MKKYLVFSLLFLVVVVSGCSNKQANKEDNANNYPASVNSQIDESATSSLVEEGAVKIIQPTTEAKALDVDKTNKVYVNEEKKISINFIDGYEKYNDNMILFGPLGKALESPVSDNRQIHIYQLGIVNYKSAKEIIKNYNITSTTTVKPTIVKIENFEVVKYAEGGMCEERTLEIIGIKYNYRFSADGCHNNQETDFKYLAETIKQLEILE